MKRLSLNLFIACIQHEFCFWCAHTKMISLQVLQSSYDQPKKKLLLTNVEEKLASSDIKFAVNNNQ